MFVCVLVYLMFVFVIVLMFGCAYGCRDVSLCLHFWCCVVGREYGAVWIFQGLESSDCTCIMMMVGSVLW